MEDSPKPEKNLTQCKDLKNKKLEKIGTSCLVPVSAGDFETYVGLTIIKDEEYKIIVPYHQVWYDCTLKSIPLCGDNDSWKRNLFSLMKRQKTSFWFSVIAEVKPADNKSTDNKQTYDLCDAAGGLSEKSAIFKVINNGELIMYPNDAEGHYSNNRGKIWLEIQRLK